MMNHTEFAEELTEAKGSYDYPQPQLAWVNSWERNNDYEDYGDKWRAFYETREMEEDDYDFTFQRLKGWMSDGATRTIRKRDPNGVEYEAQQERCDAYDYDGEDDWRMNGISLADHDWRTDKDFDRFGWKWERASDAGRHFVLPYEHYCW